MSSRPFFVTTLSVLIALVLSGLTTAPLQAADRAALEARFREANEKFEAGATREALEIYNELIEAEPGADNVWLMRAYARWTLDDLSGARADLSQALSLSPNHADAYFARARVRHQAQDYPGALNDINRTIELRADEPDARFFALRADIQRELHATTEAIQDATRAIELDPDYTAAYYLRGNLYETETMLPEAISDYSTAISQNPDHVDALTHRAWVNFYIGQWEAALADGNRARKLAPEWTGVLRIIGYTQFAQGAYEEAAALLTATADLDPGVTSAYALCIRHYALRRLGQADNRLAESRAEWHRWQKIVAQFILGEIDEETFDRLAAKTIDEVDRPGRICEAHFYIGLERLLAGDRSTARLRFQSALAQKQLTFIENALASAELARL